MEKKLIYSKAIFIILVALVFFVLGVKANFFSYTTYEQGGRIFQRLQWENVWLFSFGFLFVTTLILYSGKITRLIFSFCTNHKSFKKRLLWVGIVLLPFLVALFQTHTLWDFTGEKVDENAIYQFAVGFFGGDFNPHWFGYGTFGMYFLYAIYMILYGILSLFGTFTSLNEYATQIFHNGYFVLVARYSFAVIGVFAVLIYSGLLKRIKVPSILILLFFLVSITSYDSIHFANYLRTDLLVGFFVAVTIYGAANSDKKHFLFLMALGVAGAISAKISALPLVLLLGIYVLYRLYDKTINWKHMLGIGILFLFLLVAFQPYVDYVQKITSILNLGTSGRGGGSTAGQFNWGKVYHYSYFERFMEIFAVFEKYCSLIILLSCLLVVFSKRYIKILIPSFIALFLLVAPYFTSPEVTYYWYLPAFNVVRLIAFIGIAGFLEMIHSQLLKRTRLSTLQSKRIVYGSSTLAVLVFTLLPNISAYLNNYTWQTSNKILAQQWIEQNLLENEQLILDENVNHILPQVYDKNNLKDSKNISRVFLHNKSENVYLNSLFETYLNKEYYNSIGINTVRGVEQLKVVNVADSSKRKSLINKYFITSSASYNRYIRRQSDDLNAKRKQELETYKAYYSFMLSQPLVKRFDSGVGKNVEIYHITELNPETEE